MIHVTAVVLEGIPRRYGGWPVKTLVMNSASIYCCIIRRRADTATVWIDQRFVFSLHSLLMSPAKAPIASGSVCSHYCPFLLVRLLCVSAQLMQFPARTVGFVNKGFL
jgi:hypothetical protein